MCATLKRENGLHGSARNIRASGEIRYAAFAVQVSLVTVLNGHPNGQSRLRYRPLLPIDPDEISNLVFGDGATKSNGSGWPEPKRLVRLNKGIWKRHYSHALIAPGSTEFCLTKLHALRFSGLSIGVIVAPTDTTGNTYDGSKSCVHPDAVWSEYAGQY